MLFVDRWLQHPRPIVTMMYLILLATVLNQASSSTTVKGLRFGDDLQSYMLLEPDMTQVEESLSICSWINQISAASHKGAWITYNAPSIIHEILIADNLAWAYVLKDDTTRSATTVPQNEWHHVCLTWSFATKTKILYFDGAKIGSETTPSDRKLKTGGSMAIGQYHNTATMEASFNNYPFGGEMSKLNIFKRQLADDEISEMYTSGLCSKYEESLVDDTFLRWETLLYATPRHGNITEFPLPNCPGNSWEILYSTDFLNKIVTGELMEELRNKFDVLEEFIGHRIDEALIEHLIKHH